MTDSSDPLTATSAAACPDPAAVLHLQAEPARPFTTDELRTLLRDPGRTFDVVLARRARLAASIAAPDDLRALVVVLLACTVLAAIPYGLVHGIASWWRIAALFGGSTLLCYPSLQVFGSYLGSELRPAQNAALALLVSSVAALFTLGFSPILWFLGLTMATGDRIDAGTASIVMLALALLAGLAQLSQCLFGDRGLRTGRSVALFLFWQLLLLFVALRMARALGLLG